MNDEELLKLKAYGHQLLDVYSEVSGHHRNWVYHRLAKQLQVPEWQAHFSRMDEEMANRAIKILRILIQRKQRPLQKPNPDSKTQQKKREKRELARLNAIKHLTPIRDAVRALPKNPPLTFWKRLRIRYGL